MDVPIRLCPACGAIKWGKPISCGCGYREIIKLITGEQYFGENKVTDEIERAAGELLTKVNSLLQEMKVSSVVVTSGYRSPEHNAKIGGAKNSLHCRGQAIDLLDSDRALGNKIMQALDSLRSRGMAMEDLRYCVKANGAKWVHLQSRLPGSGNVVFIPYAGPIKIS